MKMNNTYQLTFICSSSSVKASRHRMVETQSRVMLEMAFIGEI